MLPLHAHFEKTISLSLFLDLSLSIYLSIVLFLVRFTVFVSLDLCWLPKTMITIRSLNAIYAFRITESWRKDYKERDYQEMIVDWEIGKELKKCRNPWKLYR